VNRVFGNHCAQCRAVIIAPEWSEHQSDYCIRHVWSCEVCGYQFEDMVHLSMQGTADGAITDTPCPAIPAA
jgi:hypothetical protein